MNPIEIHTTIVHELFKHAVGLTVAIDPESKTSDESELMRPAFPCTFFPDNCLVSHAQNAMPNIPKDISLMHRIFK
jgi:hypothetical protein